MGRSLRHIGRRVWAWAIVAALGLGARPATAQIPVLATWNPGGSVGAWEVPLFWIFAPPPFPPYTSGPNNNGDFIFYVLIPSGRANLATAASVTGLTIAPLGELFVNPGQLSVLTPVLNEGVLRIMTGGSLTTVDVENVSQLYIQGVGTLVTGNLTNAGTLTTDLAANIVAASVNNTGHMQLNLGVTTLATGVVNNQGTIVLDDEGSELAAALPITLVGGGELELSADTAGITAVSSLSNLGSHLIRGFGRITAPAFVNEGKTLANRVGKTLTMEVSSLDNSGSLEAEDGGTLRIDASSLSNGGLVRARRNAAIAIDTDSMDHDGTTLAEDASSVFLENASITNSGLFQALRGSRVHLEDVTIDSPTFHTDDQGSDIALSGTNVLRNGVVLQGGVWRQLGGATVLPLGTLVRNDGRIEVDAGVLDLAGNTVDNRNGEIRSDALVQITGHPGFGFPAFLTGGTLSGTGAFHFYGQNFLDATGGMAWSGPVLSVLSGGSVTIEGDVVNDATLSLQGGAGSSILALDGRVPFAGVGEIVFNSPGQNQIQPVNDAVPDVLALGPGQTMRTAGPGDRGHFGYGLELHNQGLVDARGGYLELRNALTVNDGVLRASQGGGLDIGVLNAPTRIENTNGRMEAEAGSVVQYGQAGTTIVGGTLAGPGTFQVFGAGILDATGPAGIHLDGGTTYVPAGASLRVKGDVQNDATVVLDDTDDPQAGAGRSTLAIDGAVNFDGTGEIVLDSPWQNQILPAVDATPDRFTLGPSQTLRLGGAGDRGHFGFGIDLHNLGLVDARGGYLELRNALTTNDGVLRASQGGALDIGVLNAPTRIENTNGRVEAEAGSVVQYGQAGTTIVGGTLAGPGTFQVFGAGIFDATGPGGIHLDGGTTVVPGGASLRVKGTVRNDATVSLQAGAGSSVLAIDGDVNLSGVGEVLLDSSGQNQILPVNDAVPDLLRLGPGHTLRLGVAGDRGHFGFGLELRNQGLVDARGGILELRHALTTNDGVLRASQGGALDIGVLNAPTRIQNTNGRIEAEAGSVVQFGQAGTTIVGGVLDGPGTLSVFGLATLDGSGAGGIRIGAADMPVERSGLVLKGDVTSDARIRLFGAGSATLRLDGPVRLEGAGRVQFAGTNPNQIIRSTPTGSLTLGAQHTIETTGTGNLGSIHLPLTNLGQVVADAGRIDFHDPTLVNAGRLVARNGGSLFFGTFSPLSVFDNRGGVLETRGGAESLLNTNLFRGGTIAGDLQTLIQIRNVRFEDSPHLDDAALYAWESAPVFTGTIRNDGRLMLADSSSYASQTQLRAEGVVTLDGVGTIETLSPHENYLRGSGAGARFVTGPGQTWIARPGTRAFVDVPVTLQGVMGNDGGTWYLLNPGIVNDGLVRATNGSFVSMVYTGIGGQGGWLADGGTLEFGAFAFPTQGAITARNGGLVRVRDAVLGGSRLALEAGGTIDGYGRIAVSGPASIAGELFGASGSPFTLAAGGGVVVEPGGAVRATASGGLTVEGPGFENRGSVEVAAGSRLTRPGDLVQRTGASTKIDGVLAFTGTWDIEAASFLTGKGAVQGGLVRLGGTLNPGSSPGLLSVDADIAFQDGGALEIELAGRARGTEHDALDVAGAVTLAGALSLSFLGGFETAIGAGDTFDVLSAEALSGAFANVASGGRLTTRDGLGSFAVWYGAGSLFTPTKVVLADFLAVPEPGTAALLGLGAVGLAVRRLLSKRGAGPLRRVRARRKPARAAPARRAPSGAAQGPRAPALPDREPRSCRDARRGPGGALA